ncbi:DUF1269 domain-containing protein [Rubritalea tangerina]|uniref:DUF1269 domain-containing protein n=1 Tax=Rubritalea tangerina TaxID=430798 RepID=A0ABW4ZDS3_9BACT
MNTFVAVVYDDKFKAEEVRLELLKAQQDYLIDLEDAVVATKNAKGKVKLNQAVNMTAAGAASGGFWGMLIGLIFLNPLLGFAAGAGAGAVSGALTDLGINDDMMKELSSTLDADGSALFILVRSVTSDKVVPRIAEYGGKILQSSLAHEDEAKLQAALDSAAR